jgi:hypothetical protein
MIRRVLFNAPSKTKLLSFLTFCRPVLEYASEVWDPHLSKHVDQLERVQRQAVRFVCNLKGRDSVTQCRESLGLLALEERRRGARIKLLNKIISGAKHDILQDDFLTIINCSQINTRSTAKSIPPAQSAHYDFLHYSFIHRTSRDMRKSEI